MEIVSLFAGAGGFDLGMVQAGHNLVWAVDNDADCVETYSQNLGNHILCKDIQSVESIDVPYSDVIIGGFPCQGFSLANRLRSEEDERNALYLHFKRLIADKQPLYFLAENVRGILSLAKGEVINQIVRDFESCGYRVCYKVFNTADYGVPQTRMRVIIAGTRKDLPLSKDYNFPVASHSRKNGSLSPWVTISEALRNVAEPNGHDHGVLNHIYSKYKVTNRNFMGHRVTHPERPSPTILARGNGKGGVCAIQHPGNHRRMSVRESALIQSFPMDFEFFGSMSSMYRQVGNAVPVEFAKRLGQELRL